MLLRTINKQIAYTSRKYNKGQYRIRNASLYSQSNFGQINTHTNKDNNIELNIGKLDENE